MGEALSFEQLRIGDSWESRGRTITETDVVHFAGLTGDYDPLHVDHEFARQSPFGKPIAHGLLGLSLLAGLSSTCPAVQTAAFLSVRDWEFVRPIFIGDTLRAVTKIVELARSGRRHGRVVWDRRLVNQAGEVVQRGFFDTLVTATSSVKPRAAIPAPHMPPSTAHSPTPPGREGVAEMR